MTTSSKNQQFCSEYINPMIEQYSSSEKENPLVLMAQACNNIGKEFSLPSPLLSSKQRKLNSSNEGKKSLKRSVPTIDSSPAKKISLSQSSYFPSSSSFIFDSLFFHYLNKTLSSSSSTFDFSFPYNYSNIFPSFPRSSYLMDSILSSPYICNWMDSTIQDGFCGKRFINHNHLLEHICTEHTSIKTLYPLYCSSTSIEKL